ncbi:histone acetyltransferase type B catalytic subunit-like isoform X2 [Branchiostoma floridae]|uniref:Histone acetyltransferase type B catalytic subunit n=1 Tax=Branchiostoma floridae TaxID=7739 RepID=A0A9J7HH60_BRAFL|nr:histone acetyltransferase type B catalytic subunit-like isoform X2 [Branchiostoma floridae]
MAAGTSSGMGLSRNELESFVCRANDVIDIKLVRQESDLENNKTTFRPELTHQVFGETENIFGYKDLVVKLYYTAGRLTTYLNMSYSQKVDPVRHEGMQADEVLKNIAEKIPPGFCTNIDDFSMYIPKEATFQPYGTLLHSYKRETEGGDRQFEIYKADMSIPGFREFHERLQMFVLWFIDAGSFIDVDDEKWNYYLIFEKYACDGNHRYATVGYLTAYSYYAYPDKLRPRISQVLVLPPFQRLGHGVELLQTAYRDMRENNDVLDITVEDPSEEFLRLRDFVDCMNCKVLPAFSPQLLQDGFTADMAQQAQEKLKINKKQARRVYEILRLEQTDISNAAAFREFRLDVKRRLNAPFRKESSYIEKLRKVLKPEELVVAMEDFSVENRQAKLEEMFQDNLTHYKRVLDRLAVA